ncbi:SRPBCC family protein [Saccharothrix sp. BKS2]|uniref:SRPBCC family protein n=1 Tax=Saccharothrix sp. BKS2 TaxID=3064400 RepID=UPI0039E82F41
MSDSKTKHPVDETERELGQRTIGAGEAHSAIMRRVYSAPIDEVWSAITDPDRITRYFLPVSGDLREGGSFSIEMNADGEILKCDAPNLLRVTWSYEGSIPDEVEIRLKEVEGGTQLELEHASVRDVLVSSDPKTGDYGVGAGWEAPLKYLGKHLAGELPNKPSLEWYEPTEEDADLSRDAGMAWSQVIEAAYVKLLKQGSKS